MKKSLWAVALFLPVIVLSGCAGQLQVFDSGQSEIKGVPFRGTQVYVKEGTRNKHSKGAGCDPVKFVETVTIPTGDLYYVNVKTAQFAKTGFHIKFGDNGAVSEIAMDSEPSGAETLKATNDLLKTVLPVVGISLGAAAASDAGGAKPPAGKPACDAGEENVKFTPLDKYNKP